jgi:hypothetical protein
LWWGCGISLQPWQILTPTQAWQNRRCADKRALAYPPSHLASAWPWPCPSCQSSDSLLALIAVVCSCIKLYLYHTAAQSNTEQLDLRASRPLWPRWWWMASLPCCHPLHQPPAGHIGGTSESGGREHWPGLTWRSTSWQEFFF